MEEFGKVLTEDLDMRDTELSVLLGGNGDYYVQVSGTSYDEKRHSLAVRICTSGGFHSHRLKLAVSELFNALQENNGYKEGFTKEKAEEILNGYSDPKGN